MYWRCATLLSRDKSDEGSISRANAISRAPKHNEDKSMGILEFRRLSKGRLTAFALAVGLATIVQPSARAENGDDSMAILKAMSNYVDAQQSIALMYESDIEVITPQLQKLQFASSGQVLLDRPDKLHLTRHGGYADVDVYYDGKQATIFGNNINAFASKDVQGTIDQLIDKLRGELGIDAPSADLLFSHSFEGMTADVIDARHIGRGVVDGVECEHLAFRNVDTDWQIWVEVGPKPIPHKYVITSKTMAGAPQYTLRISGWKSNTQPTVDMFAFRPPAGAKQIDLNALSGLDEVPPGKPVGAK
jgi:hypothetical protein